ncbi:MAG: decarboxylating 6-phosphogluconate dehydrogenase [Clostridia bacterium]|nr:decarboxylating 6-phosphogluconate dehydrogenase [Clostridia bacterium]
MQVGLIGLGRMGFNLAQNMIDHGHQVVAYNRSPDKTKAAQREGINGVYALEGLVEKLTPPRVVWLMLPAGDPVESMLGKLIPLLVTGDTVIDGGNSHYQDSIRHYQALTAKGINFADVGTSGGLAGARHGICAMVGAEDRVFKQLEPLIASISVPEGYIHTGPPGSGHFVKMVHNGIEYGMLQAIGEGFEVLARGPFPFNLQAIAQVFNHGSVIRSWLMHLLEQVLKDGSQLATIKPIVHSSGEGMWMVQTALRLGIPTPVIAASVFARYQTENQDQFAAKVVAALRHQFGGHNVETTVPERG